MITHSGTAEPPGLHIVYKHFRPMNLTICSGKLPTKEIDIKQPFHYQRGRTKWKPALRGGKTQCFIYDEERHMIAMGETVCSKNDNFCYAEGRGWARDRALAKLDERGKDD